MSNYDARIYRFISKRYRYWKTPAQIRQDTNRRISYSGEDADEVLKETRALYGTIPLSIAMQIGDSKIQIHRDGLFLLRQVNFKTIGILREIVDRIVTQLVQIRNTSQKFNVKIKKVNIGNMEFSISNIVCIITKF